MLFAACELKSPSMSSFLGGIESSGWLRHIRSILETSWFIAQAVDKQAISVVVHCSDGWDRTAQVCSLGSLFLDPYYRTIQGFQVLFVKSCQECALLGHAHKFRNTLCQMNGDQYEYTFNCILNDLKQIILDYIFISVQTASNYWYICFTCKYIM
jgi:myotubularin-related protein 6/7/8